MHRLTGRSECCEPMACICSVPGRGGFSLMRCYLRAARNVISAFSRAIVSSRSSDAVLSTRPGCGCERSTQRVGMDEYGRASIPRRAAVPRTAASTCGSSDGLICEGASRAQQYGPRACAPHPPSSGHADGRLSAALTVAGSMTNEATRMATDAATNSIANSGWPPLIPSAAPI